MTREHIQRPAARMRLAGAVALGLGLAPFGAAEAADDAQADLIKAQAAEIERLRQELDALRPRPQADAAVPAALPTSEASAKDVQQLDQVLIRGRVAPLAKVKDEAASISVVSGEELQRFGVTRFADVLRKLGNVRVAGATGLVTGQNLSTRGIGFPGGSPQDPGIGVSVDGVSYAFSDMAGSFNFYDLESVDVARGPQGTTGGLASNYGRISFRTRAPSFRDEAEASLTFGQRKTLIARGVLGGAVIDDLLAWRGTFFREQAQGTYVNQYDVSQSLYNKDRTSGRLQFLLTPTRDFSARLSYEATPKGAESGSSSGGAFSRATPAYYDSLDAQGNRIKVDQNLEPAGRLARAWFQQDSSYRYLDADGTKDAIERSDGPPQERETRGAFAELNWQLEGRKLTSLTAWRDYTFQWHGKNSTLRDVFDIMRAPSQAWTFYKQFSQELKIASDPGGAFDYQAGVHWLKTQTLSGKPGWGSRYGSDAGAYYATDAQYNGLAGPGADPAGRFLLSNSVNRLNISTNSRVEGYKGAVFGDLGWHLTPAFTLNAGVRLSREHSQTLDSSSYVSHQGYAPELNPVSINNVQLGGFNSNTRGELASGNSAAQLALADAVATKYFNKARYSDLTTEQKQQVAYAKAIRAARIGSVYAATDAAPFNDTLVNASLSPSLKLDGRNTAYVSISHGEKAGVSQIVGGNVLGGKSALTKPETTNAFEIGLKSELLERRLLVNTSLFVQKIRNYIQSLYYYDEQQTLLNNDGRLAYTAGLGNVPKITTRGIEVDAVYTLPRTTFRVAGAYVDPKYDDFQYAAKPPELGGTSVPYYDIRGRTIAGASRLSYNLSVDHAVPVWGDHELHGGLNYNRLSSFNPNASLSRYAVQKGYGLTDLSVGLRTANRKFDVTLLVRNLLNVQYGSLYDWNSYSPSEPRWVGVTVSARL